MQISPPFNKKINLGPVNQVPQTRLEGPTWTFSEISRRQRQGRAFQAWRTAWEKFRAGDNVEMWRPITTDGGEGRARTPRPHWPGWDPAGPHDGLASPWSVFDGIMLRNNPRLTHGAWVGWADIQGTEACSGGAESHMLMPRSTEQKENTSPNHRLFEALVIDILTSVP